MPLVTNSSITSDQEKYLAKKLIDRSYLKLAMSAAVEKVTMREGSGLTAFMVRFQRMATPQAV